MNVTIDIRKARRDPRGISFEFLNEDMSRWISAHAASTNAGAIRGNHFHPTADELLLVAGPALVRLAAPGEALHDVEIGFDEVARFFIPAGVAHAVQGRGEGSILVSLSSEQSPATCGTGLL